MLKNKTKHLLKWILFPESRILKELCYFFQCKGKGVKMEKSQYWQCPGFQRKRKKNESKKGRRSWNPFQESGCTNIVFRFLNVHGQEERLTHLPKTSGFLCTASQNIFSEFLNWWGLWLTLLRLAAHPLEGNSPCISKLLTCPGIPSIVLVVMKETKKGFQPTTRQLYEYSSSFSLFWTSQRYLCWAWRKMLMNKSIFISHPSGKVSLLDGPLRKKKKKKCQQISLKNSSIPEGWTRNKW